MQFFSQGRVTPITREGVQDASQLSGDGQKAHLTRFGGPGTRRKDPAAYDRGNRATGPIKGR